MHGGGTGLGGYAGLFGAAEAVAVEEAGRAGTYPHLWQVGHVHVAMLRLVDAVVSKKGNALHNGGLGTAHTQFSNCAASHVAKCEACTISFYIPTESGHSFSRPYK